MGRGQTLRRASEAPLTWEGPARHFSSFCLSHLNISGKIHTASQAEAAPELFWSQPSSPLLYSASALGLCRGTALYLCHHCALSLLGQPAPHRCPSGVLLLTGPVPRTSHIVTTPGPLAPN